MTDTDELTNPYSHEAEGWQDLLGEDYNDEDGWSWTFYQDYEGNSPHQRWKIHVSAEPEDGREVAKAVLPYLQENSIEHKITDSPYRLERYRRGQQNKFITVFPSYDPEKKDEITEIFLNSESEEIPLQCFETDSKSHNIEAINSNTQRTAAIIGDLLEKLDEEGIRSGPTIPGHNNEEFQVGESRVHYRYSTSRSDGVIRLGDHEPVIGEKILGESEYDIVEDDKMIGPGCTVISDQRYSNPPEVARHPVDLI